MGKGLIVHTPFNE